MVACHLRRSASGIRAIISRRSEKSSRSYRGDAPEDDLGCSPEGLLQSRQTGMINDRPDGIYISQVA